MSNIFSEVRLERLRFQTTNESQKFGNFEVEFLFKLTTRFDGFAKFHQEIRGCGRSAIDFENALEIFEL